MDDKTDEETSSECCAYCGLSYGDVDSDLDIVEPCNESSEFNDYISNEDTCNACVNCCPGHCCHCADVFEEETGGRFIGGYADSKECSWDTCDHRFHFNSAWCKDGIRCKDKTPKQYYCTKHVQDHLELCKVCSPV